MEPTSPKEVTDVRAPSDGEAKYRPVFLSYAVDERDYAERLHDVLERLGYSVWLDRKIAAGTVWTVELESRLSAAGAVVVLWSKRAVTSTWVRYEAAHAIGRRVYIGCRIENGVELLGPFDQIQVPTLVGWDGTPETAGFRSILNQIAFLIGTQPTSDVELIPQPTWPPRVPRAVLWRARLWIQANLFGLVLAACAFFLTLAVLGIVYRALDVQLGKLGNATDKVEAESAQTAATLAQVDKRLDAVAKTADTLRTKSAELEKNVTSVADVAKAAAEMARVESIYNEPLQQLEFFTVYPMIDPLGALAGERFGVIHGDVYRFWIHFSPLGGEAVFRPSISLYGSPTSHVISRQE